MKEEKFDFEVKIITKEDGGDIVTGVELHNKGRIVSDLDVVKTMTDVLVIVCLNVGINKEDLLEDLNNSFENNKQLIKIDKTRTIH